MIDLRPTCFVLITCNQMAAWLPLPSGFTGYATRFVDPALGFCLGWNYWFKVRSSAMIPRQLILL